MSDYLFEDEDNEEDPDILDEDNFTDLPEPDELDDF